MHKYTIVIAIGVSFYDAAKLLQDDNCIIITSNWMAWWSLNDLRLCLLSLSLKDNIVRIYFYLTIHMIFPGGSVGSRRPNVWSIDSQCRPKIDSLLHSFTSLF